jgi:hypothetical protein
MLTGSGGDRNIAVELSYSLPVKRNDTEFDLA